VKARPDMVEVSLGVTAIADTAAAAQSAIAEREARVLDRAAKLGIPSRDTKTASYRIDPQYSYQPGVAARLTGYQARRPSSLSSGTSRGSGLRWIRSSRTMAR